MRDRAAFRELEEQRQVELEKRMRWARGCLSTIERSVSPVEEQTPDALLLQCVGFRTLVHDDNASVVGARDKSNPGLTWIEKISARIALV
jgi:hypothetical protein